MGAGIVVKLPYTHVLAGKPGLRKSTLNNVFSGLSGMGKITLTNRKCIQESFGCGKNKLK